MKLYFKIFIWALFTVGSYFAAFELLVYIDPAHPNIRGLKTLSSFVVLFPSYFIGSYLSKK
tara:strand:- start:813 stop:995 length:183 start_codon:yes stop_codon:yes gene_type:complete